MARPLLHRGSRSEGAFAQNLIIAAESRRRSFPGGDARSKGAHAALQQRVGASSCFIVPNSPAAIWERTFPEAGGEN